MPDWSIQNYKNTPSANNAINGIDISDKTGLPGSLNDALRQLMADVAASGLLNPELYVSTDSGTALKIGSDGKLYANPEEIQGGTPMLLISSDADNRMAPGTDGKLLVTLEAVLSIAWAALTGKPSRFPASPHGASHGPGGSDVIPTFFPSGSIALWHGTLAAIPSGWIVCDGFNGTPDLRDRFVLGAGTSALPNQVGGYAPQDLEISSAGASFAGQESHSHEFRGTLEEVSKVYSGLENIVIQAGFSTAPMYQQTLETAEARHLHKMRVPMAQTPPYRAIYHIMKT